MNIRGRLKKARRSHLAISVLLVAFVLLACMPSAVSADDGTHICRDDGPTDHQGSSDVIRGTDNLPSRFTGSCFLKGTLVKTENGEKPIEEMQAGDRVWSYNTSCETWQLETVSATFEHSYSGDVVTIDVAGSEIVATGNHPFWVVAGDDLADRAWPEDIYIYEKAMTETGRWVEARDLRAGDELLLIEGRACIIGLAIEDLDTTVYNIGVGEQHTYAVSEAGVLVHNKALRNANFVAPQGHHPVPKFLGGNQKQKLSWLSENVHTEYHSLLRQNLKEAGIPLHVGGIGGSYADWSRYMIANQGAQRKALDAVLETSHAIDYKHGTHITRDFWQNVVEGNLVSYP